MIKERIVYMVFLVLAVFGAFQYVAAQPSFPEFEEAFIAGYTAMEVERFTLDMRERLSAVPDTQQLRVQQQFFSDQQAHLHRFQRGRLRVEERVRYDLIAYEINFHLQRITLEQGWVQGGRPIPTHSLHDLPAHEAWYRLFVRRFTGTDITPEQVFQLGERETQRCLHEIARISKELGYADSASFQQALDDDLFYLTDKQAVLAGFARIDSTVRQQLAAFVTMDSVPIVQATEWPGAGANTPPGIYLAREHNGLNADVFQFNFFGGRYNTRAMGWIYLHEAIPGHHLQSSLRRVRPPNDLREHVLYPGNFEGWACYVEYYGDELGVYADPYQRLGKWEWDLVRSVRLVLDAGIHYYGWSHQQALDHWKRHVPGQDAIAEREVTRVTNWAGQALSYKVGADRLQRMRETAQRKMGKDFSAAAFHRAFLDLGMVPLQIAEQALNEPLDP